jgi:hypothetical protein
LRAVLCREWGGPETLALGAAETPAPGPGQVLVQVAAAGVNFADILMVAGKYQEQPPFPFSPGLEVAGRVEAVGAGVSRVVPGERVLALTDGGGFAEVAVARESDVFALPEEMDFVTAAGFPITYATAHGGLVWRAALQPDEVLLVHGAAGGVGLAAVEVGKALGATVIATAGGPDKLAVAEAHGADHLIDYKREDIRGRVKALTGGHGADVGGLRRQPAVRRLGRAARGDRLRRRPGAADPGEHPAGQERCGDRALLGLLPQAGARAVGAAVRTALRVVPRRQTQAPRLPRPGLGPGRRGPRPARRAPLDRQGGADHGDPLSGCPGP